MAALRNGVLKLLFNSNKNILSNCNRQRDAFLPVVRHNVYFRKNSIKPDHNEIPYEYEESKDPNEWKWVERLIPRETVPEPNTKPIYPSGWRPQTAKPGDYPYFIERSKNHMLPVYFKRKMMQEYKDYWMEEVTILRRVRGDIWAVYEELKDLIQQERRCSIPCIVHESNSSIYFKGEHVYLIEQWLLKKGF